MRWRSKLLFGFVLLLLGIGGSYYVWMEREVPVIVAVAENNVEVRVFGIGTSPAQGLVHEHAPKFASE